MDLKQNIAAFVGVDGPGSNKYVHSVHLYKKMPTTIAVKMLNSWGYTWSVIKYRLRHPFGGYHYH